MKAGVDYTGVTVFFFCHDGKGNFLMHKRSQNCRDERGKWDCGGGKLEFGEDLRAAVLRELKEEHGCDGEIQEQFPASVRARESDGVATHWVTIGFLIKVDPAQVVNNEPEAIDEFGWFRLDALPQPLHSAIPLDISENKELLQRYS